MRGLPLFFPDTEYVPHLAREGTIPLHALCEECGVSCRASGAWIERPILLVRATQDFPYGRLRAEPGYRNAVEVSVPNHYCDTRQSMARYALGALAYSNLRDLVSRESIRNAPWAKIDQEEKHPSFKTNRTAKGVSKMDNNEFSTLLSLCKGISTDYNAVFIGGIAVYLHSCKENKKPEMTHDADFYVSMSEMSALRDDETFTSNPRLGKSQLVIQGFDFDIYTERQSSLIVPYDVVSAYREEIDGIQVACPEHLLALKLEAYANRKGSSKGDKDARDLINIMSVRSDFRPGLCAEYLTNQHLELLGGIPKHQMVTQMVNNNAQLAKRLRTSLQAVVEKIQHITGD